MMNEKQPSLYLAPMAGITDQVFRRLCFEQGCDCATTEMVSAQGFLTAPADRNAYRFLLARFLEEETGVGFTLARHPESAVAEGLLRI